MNQLDKNQAGKILTIKDGIVDNVVSQESTFSSSKIMSIIQGIEIDPDSGSSGIFATVEQIEEVYTAIDDAKKEAQQIESNMSDALQSTKEDLLAEDSKIKNDITQLDYNHSRDITSITSKINEITSSYKAADTSLNNKITALTNRLDNLDESGSSSGSGSGVSSEELEELQTRLEALSTTVSTNKNDVDTAISSLDTAYKEVDTTMISKITSLENTVGLNKETTDTAISNLTKAYKDADTALTTKTNKIETDYKAADNTLKSSIDKLTTDYQDADDAIITTISSLDTAYKNADISINSKITDLEKAYKKADTSLESKITTLTSRVSTLESGGTGGGSDIDVTDFASQDDITSLWTALGDLTNVVDAIVDKLSTNTAVATAFNDDATTDEPGLMD